MNKVNTHKKDIVSETTLNAVKLVINFLKLRFIYAPPIVRFQKCPGVDNDVFPGHISFSR